MRKHQPERVTATQAPSDQMFQAHFYRDYRKTNLLIGSMFGGARIAYLDMTATIPDIQEIRLPDVTRAMRDFGYEIIEEDFENRPLNLGWTLTAEGWVSRVRRIPPVAAAAGL